MRDEVKSFLREKWHEVNFAAEVDRNLEEKIERMADLQLEQMMTKIIHEILIRRGVID